MAAGLGAGSGTREPAATMSLMMYSGLTSGAYSALHAHGTEAQKATYLPKLVSGTWTGTMNLTEAHCGTDLGLLRTRAEPQDDGSYHITGSKIFISAGEPDLAENISHPVLAPLHGAPEGSQGLWLAGARESLVSGGGSLGRRVAFTVSLAAT